MRWMFAVGLLWLVSSAYAQEWSRFRGPNGTGTSKVALPTQWTQKDYLWKTAIPGRGHSSPVVWQDRIYVTSGEPGTGQRLVLCVDASSGKIVWQRDFAAGKYKMHARNSVATSTPTVDKDRLYVAWGTPKQVIVQALDGRTGADVWQIDLGPYASQHGFGSSPILYEDILILSNEQDKKGWLVALDVKSGKKRWELARNSGNATYSTPCIYQPTGKPAAIVFTNWQHGITAVDPRSGKVQWETSVFEPKKAERAIASPIIAGDLVIGTCGFVTAQKHFVAVRPDSNGKAIEVWRVEKPVAYMPTPIVKDNRIYSCTELGILSCIDATTGKQIWHDRIEGAFSASPVCAGSAIYCVSNRGDVFVVEAAEKFKQLARNPLGEPTQCTPAIADNCMVFRTDGHLLAIGANK